MSALSESALSDSPNHFLACLSLQQELLQSHLKPMELGLGAIFYRAQDTIDRVYFPHTGVVSLVVGLASGQFVEAGMFGRNSAVGGGASLDSAVALNQAIGQVAGAGVVAEAQILKRFVAQSETLRRLVLGMCCIRRTRGMPPRLESRSSVLGSAGRLPRCSVKGSVDPACRQAARRLPPFGGTRWRAP
jgi:hypothetical protein